MTARIALAGHPPPVLIAGTPRLLENAGGLPLGMMDTSYVEEHITLTPGARLVLYSDGVQEAQSPNGEEYGFSDKAFKTTCAVCERYLTARRILCIAALITGKCNQVGTANAGRLIADFVSSGDELLHDSAGY